MATNGLPMRKRRIRSQNIRASVRGSPLKIIEFKQILTNKISYCTNYDQNKKNFSFFIQNSCATIILPIVWSNIYNVDLERRQNRLAIWAIKND